MNSLIDEMKGLGELYAGKGVSTNVISAAEKKLELHFSDDYIDYLKAFGTAAVNGHELTGLGCSERVDVTIVTEERRASNNTIPKDLYVVEEANIDDIVFWQSKEGVIFMTLGNSEPKKVSDGLLDLLRESI